MLDAIVFDFDGVIVDTEALHHRAFQQLLEGEGMGCTWEEYQEHYIGFDDRDALKAMAERHGHEIDEATLRDWIVRKAYLFARMAHGGECPAKEGVAALLESIRKEGLPIGLCSGALREDIDPILHQLALDAYFEIMVTADDVRRSKPDPESYRLSLDRLSERLGRRLVPGRCIAIEDTPAGIEAARGAGLQVVGLAGTFPADALEGALAVVDSLALLSAEKLSQLYDGQSLSS